MNLTGLSSWMLSTNYYGVSQPTGPGCQRKNPWVLHTNDPVNLGSGPEFWLQFANAIEFGQNNCADFGMS